MLNHRYESPGIQDIYAAQSWEVDVNSNSSREIVYTFGSPEPNVRIITGNGDLEIDLNSAFDVPSVEYAPGRNDFEVTYPNSPGYRYSFQPKTLTLKRIK